MAGKSYGPSDTGKRERWVPAGKPEGDTFRAFLRGLPDDIARLEEQRGEPFVVVFPEEPHDQARRLLDALGVTVRIEPGPAPRSNGGE